MAELVERVRGVTLNLSVVFGSVAVPMAPSESGGQAKFRWWTYLRGVHNEDLSPIIQRCVFFLHPTFDPPQRTIEKPPFELQEQGWGEFLLRVKVFFHDPYEEPVTLSHMLKLFGATFVPGGAAAVASAGGSVPQTPVAPLGITASMRTVVSERYDEIMFVDPTRAMFEKMKHHLSESKPNAVATDLATFFQPFDIDASVARVRDARVTVGARLQVMKKRAERIDADTEVVQAQLAALERDDAARRDAKRASLAALATKTKTPKAAADSSAAATPMAVDAQR